MLFSLNALLDPPALLYILLGACALIGVLLGWVVRLEWKLRQFTLGKSGRSLEELFSHLKKKYDDTQAFQCATEHYLRAVETRLQKSIRSAETLRFNPFENEHSGGSQSFATAFMNERGDGVVFSSIYARDRMCIFAKPLKHFASEHELSDEERAVILRAKERLNTP